MPARRIMIRIVTTFVLAALLLPASNAYAAKKKFDDFCLEVLETLQSFYPVNATAMGIHAYDNRLTDYSSSSVKKMIDKLTDYEKSLYQYGKQNLTDKQRLNHKLIKSNVDIALLDLKQIKWHNKSGQLYADEVVEGVYSLLLSKHAPMNEKVVTIISRMRTVPTYLATAKKNIRKSPPIYVEAAVETLEGAIDFYKDVAGELMNKFPERADEILKVSTKAREAMDEFSLYLAELPISDAGAFAIGTKNYDYKLTNEYFLDIDADSLLKIGLALVAESDRAYHEYKEYVETRHQNGSDSVYVPDVFTKDDIMNYYNWETEQVKIFIEQNNLVAVPDDIAPITVVETPPFLRSMIAGIAYHPAGPFDTLQQGFFYVRPIPDDLDRRQLEARYRYVHRRGFKGSVVHEAFPGHHLQMQIAARNADPVLKWQMNLQLIEGWALYCEEMMYHAGLYGDEDPAQWLGVLGGIRFRAARIVADVKLHTGQFTVEECYDWMCEMLDADSDANKAYIRNQVRKYTLAPTMPMTYLTGKLEIMKLREAMQRAEGENFNLGRFHDQLLAHGSIPPALLWDVLGLTKN